MGMKKNLAKNVIVYTGIFVISSILLFVSRAYIYKYLGDDIAGVASLFVSILAFLNLSELGLSVAVMYSLYKPVEDKDYVKVNGIIHLYRSLYKKCSIAVLAGGAVVTLFISIFNKSSISNADVRVYFIFFLVSNVISYYFYHNVTLFFVYEQAYIMSIADLLTKVIKVILQILVMVYTRSYLNYLLLEIAFNLIYYISLELMARRRFNFLYKEESALNELDKQEIFKNIKGAVFHKLGAFIVFGTDSLLISYFINVAVTGIYANYMMVINFCGSLMAKIFEPLAATIGRFITRSSDEKQVFGLFNNLYLINYVLAVNLTTGLYFALNNFVKLWLGEGKLINSLTFVLIIVNFYITAMRPSIERFKEAAGILYKDRYVAVVESLINLVASLILVHYMGLSGVVAGTVISNIVAVVIIKPYYTFKYVLKRPFSTYISYYVKGVLLLGINLALINFVLASVFKVYNYTIGNFLIRGITSVIMTNLLLLVVALLNKDYRKLVLTFISRVERIK